MRRRNHVTDGALVAACGVLHTVVGVVLASRDVIAFARDGFFNAVYHVSRSDLTSFDAMVGGFADLGGSRPRTFWFLWTGLAWILLGLLCHWIERTLQHKLPGFVGVGLFVYAACGFVLVPVSGFAVLAVTCVVLIRRSASAE